MTILGIQSDGFFSGDPGQGVNSFLSARRAAINRSLAHGDRPCVISAAIVSALSALCLRQHVVNGVNEMF